MGRRCRTLPSPASLATLWDTQLNPRVLIPENPWPSPGHKKTSRLTRTGRVVSSVTEREGLSSGPFGILARLGDYPHDWARTDRPLGSNRGSHPSPNSQKAQSPHSLSTAGASASSTEREGFEPPSPFGRSLSRRVQYHSASAPKRQRPSVARCASAGASIPRNVNNDGTSLVGAPGWSCGRLRRSSLVSGRPPAIHPHSPGPSA